MENIAAENPQPDFRSSESFRHSFLSGRVVSVYLQKGEMRCWPLCERLWGERSSPQKQKRRNAGGPIIRTRFKTMNTVELDSGRCRVADLSRRGEAEHLPELDYAAYISNAVANSVHPEDVEMFQAPPPRGSG